MIAGSDAFSPAYPSREAFVAGLLGDIKIAGRRQGWPGFTLHSARWDDAGAAPQITIAIVAGTGDVTVDDVRRHILEARKAGA